MAVKLELCPGSLFSLKRPRGNGTGGGPWIQVSSLAGWWAEMTWKLWSTLNELGQLNDQPASMHVIYNFKKVTQKNVCIVCCWKKCSVVFPRNHLQLQMFQEPNKIDVWPEPFREKREWADTWKGTRVKENVLWTKIPWFFSKGDKIY